MQARPRPRFVVRAPHPPAEVRRRVQQTIDASDRLRGIAFEHRLEVGIDGPEHHFYSPQVVVAVSPDGDGSRLDGRIGPDPYVWALYFLLTGTFCALALFAALFGLSQWLAGGSPSALYFTPVAMGLAGLVYGASFVGQGLGAAQTYFLRHAIVDAVDGEDVDG